MGIHDRLAHTAFLNGRRAKQFEVAAERNANGFWTFAVVTGLTWWLADGMWWIVPALVAGWCVIKSFSATMIQTRLEKIEDHVRGPAGTLPPP